MHCDINCEPDLSQTSTGMPSQKGGSLLLMLMVLKVNVQQAHMGEMFWCLHTFDHLVHIRCFSKWLFVFHTAFKPMVKVNLH